eukprot:363767-Chlamydomonas_euryale.AAC.6
MFGHVWPCVNHVWPCAITRFRTLSDLLRAGCSGHASLHARQRTAVRQLSIVVRSIPTGLEYVNPFMQPRTRLHMQGNTGAVAPLPHHMSHTPRCWCALPTACEPHTQMLVRPSHTT